MRTIIAGGRDITAYVLVEQAMDESGFWPSLVLCGGASGVDELGKQWAEQREIPVAVYRANWSRHGNAAGPIRNREMAENADALVAVWDGHSRGTKNMIEEATKRGLKVHVHHLSCHP